MAEMKIGVRAAGLDALPAFAATVRRNWSDWWHTPILARLWLVGAFTAAVTLTMRSLPEVVTDRGVALTLALLALGSAINIEVGRWLEGGRLERDRTHKGLSAWPFTAALLLPLGVAGWVTLFAYA